jgi:uncharacterized membrane protein YdjX (TVP38/TMEM64 family)
VEKSKRIAIIFIGLFVIATGVLAILFWPFIRQLEDPEYRERFSAWIKGLGLKGVAILFGLQVLQIVVAVIPGEAVELIAGAAYGAWGGLAICIAGCVAATLIIFCIVRRWGRALVLRLFGAEKTGAWTFLEDVKKTRWVVFLLFLIPGTPKDMLSYIVPLSKLTAAQFILISSFARIPSILTSTIMGDSMVRGNWLMFLLIFLITALTGFLGMQFRDRIIRRVKKDVPPLPK